MGLGDRIPFGEYVRSRGASLFRAAHALTGNRDDAEDLVQTTLVKAYQSWDSVADPAAVDTYVRDLLQRALDRLPRRMRAAVVLRYCDDMSEPEVAAALGVSVGTVKSTVARAVAKLREDSELGTDSTP
jgi:DNA-directed RNA polymerase specialized sigma24 family protein